MGSEMCIRDSLKPDVRDYVFARARESAGGGVVEAALRKPDVRDYVFARARESAVFSRVICAARGDAVDRSAGCWCRCCGSGRDGDHAALGAAARAAAGLAIDLVLGASVGAVVGAVAAAAAGSVIGSVAGALVGAAVEGLFGPSAQLSRLWLWPF